MPPRNKITKHLGQTLCATVMAFTLLVPSQQAQATTTATSMSNSVGQCGTNPEWGGMIDRA